MTQPIYEVTVDLMPQVTEVTVEPMPQVIEVVIEELGLPGIPGEPGADGLIINGGTAGQALIKQSDDDLDADWGDVVLPEELASAVVTLTSAIGERLTSSQAAALIATALEPYAQSDDVTDQIAAAINAIPEGITPTAVVALINDALSGYLTASQVASAISDALASFADAGALSDEIAARIAGDTSLAEELAQESVDRIDGDSDLATALDGESIIRSANDTTLQSHIDTEAASRATADATLQTNINTEATTRASADATLQTNIDAEATTRAAAVTAETNARIAAVTEEHNGWTAAVGQEVLDRSAAITAEVTARNVAIQAKYDLILGGVGPAFDTLNELSTELQSAESATSALVVVVAGKMTKTANLSDLTDIPAARSTLGLGSAALAATTDFDAAGAASAVQALAVLKANNLSDLPSPTAARTNLGLGSAATLNSGTSSGDLAVLSTGGRFARSFLPTANAYLDTAQTFTDTQTVTPAIASNVPLIVKGFTSQSADLQQWIDSTSALKAGITPAGGIYSNNRATIGATVLSTAARLVVLAGGTTDVGAIVRGGASQSGDLQQWQDSTTAVLARITSAGALTLGSSTATLRAQSGNPGRLETLGGLWPVAGSTTDLGGGGTYRFATIYGKRIDVSAASAVSVPAVVQGFTSQSANLQEWQDSAATVLSKIDSSGRLTLAASGGLSSTASLQITPSGGNNDIGTSAGRFRFFSGSSMPAIIGETGVHSLAVTAMTAATIGMKVVGATSQTSDLTQWQNASATVLAKLDSSGNMFANRFIGTSGQVNIGSASVAALYVNASPGAGVAAVTADSFGGSATANVFVVKSSGISFGGDFQQWQNSSGSVLFSVNSSGQMKWSSANAQTTVGAAGAASALPVTPTKYLQVRDSAGTLLVIPAYAAA